MRRLTIFGDTSPLEATFGKFRRLDVSLAAAVTLVAAVHVLLLIFWNPSLPAPDPDSLGNIAHLLLDGQGYRNNVGHQPSAYPAPASTTILAGVFAVAGDSPLAIHAYNGAVFVGAVLLTYYAARQLVRPWFAAASALLVATYVPLLGGILLVRYEGIQGFFTLAAVALTLSVLRRPGQVRGGLAGVAWAGSLLVKPVVLFFPLIAALWVRIAGGRKARGTAWWLAGAFIIVTLPWAIRVVTSTHSTALGFLPLLIGATYSEEAHRDMGAVNAFVDEIRDEQDPAADPLGFEVDMAGRFFEKVLEDPIDYARTIIGAAARFWQDPEAEWTNQIAGSGLVSNKREMWDYRGFRTVHIVALGIAGVGALAAIVYRRREAVFLLSFLVFFTLVYAFTFNNARYYLPVWAVAAVLAGFGLERVWALLRGLPSSVLFPVAAFALVIGLSLAAGPPQGPNILRNGRFDSPLADSWVVETWGEFPNPRETNVVRADGKTFLRMSLERQPLETGQRVVQKVEVEGGKRYKVGLDYRYDPAIGSDSGAEAVVFDVTSQVLATTRLFVGRSRLRPVYSRWEHAEFHFSLPENGEFATLNLELRWSSPAVDITNVTVNLDPGLLPSLRPFGGFLGAYWLPRVGLAVLLAIAAYFASRLGPLRRMDVAGAAIAIGVLILVAANLFYAWRLLWPYVLNA